MIVDLRTIPEGSRRFQFVLEEDWWPSHAQKDQILAIDAPVQVNLEIYKAGDKFVLDGELYGGLQVVCDRCLEAYHRELGNEFKVYLALPLPQEGDTEMELGEKEAALDLLARATSYPDQEAMAQLRDSMADIKLGRIVDADEVL